MLVDQGDLGVLPLDRAADDAAALAVLRPVAVGGVRREGEEGPVEGRECPGRGGRLLGKCKERRKVARMWRYTLGDRRKSQSSFPISTDKPSNICKLTQHIVFNKSKSNFVFSYV